MRRSTLSILTAAAAAFQVTAAVAEAPVAPSVTAPAIAWPVVYAAAPSQTVHIAPGVSATLSATPPPAEQPAAAAPPPPPPSPTLAISIDLSRQRMSVSEHGAEKYTWAISSARAGYRTPTGTFKPTWMSKMWYSRQYNMSPMPHSIFFTGGVAIHATYATGQLGSPASHGCVRLAPKNAATLYKLVNAHGKSLTRITVHGKPKSGGALVASKRRNAQPRYAQAPFGYGFGYSTSAYSQPYFVQKPAYAPQHAQKKRRNVQRQPKRTTYSYGYGGGY